MLAAELRTAGISTLEDLRSLGYLEAVRRLRAVNSDRDCVHSGLAIAGAIRAIRWTLMDPTERQSLIKELRTLSK